MLKRWAKSMLRPIVRWYLYPRIDVRIQQALAERNIDTLSQQLRILLNQAASFASAEREARRRHQSLEDRVARQEQRLEFVRREILFEVRHRNDGPAVGSGVAPRIVNRRKLETAGDDIRINLGCGHVPIDGFINIDVRELDGVDVVADVRSLPFEPASISAIHTAHLLEHFPLQELERTLLPYWFSLLRPGGYFSSVVPDMEAMVAEYVAGSLSFDDLRRVTYGEQEYEENFHFNMFSRESLCKVLSDVGFIDVELPAAGRRNGICYEMEVRAIKPMPKASPGRTVPHESRSGPQAESEIG